MKRVALLVVALIAINIAGAGCKKKEQPPPMPPPGQGMPPAPAMPGQPGMPGAPAPHGMPGVGSEKKVVVPDAVKATWKAVKIEVELKEKKSKKEYTVPLNTEFKVPNTDLALKVGDFLPHFAMGEGQITSASNNPDNPAVRVEVQEGGKAVFAGWLFGKFPDVHPFQHEKYALRLVEAVKK